LYDEGDRLVQGPALRRQLRVVRPPPGPGAHRGAGAAPLHAAADADRDPDPRAPHRSDRGPGADGLGAHPHLALAQLLGPPTSAAQPRRHLEGWRRGFFY